MEELIGYIAVANTILEMLSIMKVSEGLIDAPKSRNRILSVLIYLCIILSTILINILFIPRLFFLVNYFLIILMVRSCYQVKFLDAILYAVFSVILVSALELLIYVPFYGVSLLFFKGKDITIFAVLTTFTVCCVMKKKGILYSGKKLFYKWNGTEYLIYICLISILIYAMNSLKISEGFSLSEGIYLIILLLVFLIAMRKISAYRIEVDLHKKYTERYGEVINDIRNRQHKFMNQLDSIYMLTELYKTYDELVENQRKEIVKLRNYMLPNKILILDRPLVIAHVYSKMCEAEERHIDLSIELSYSLYGVNIPDIYLIEIIGNLLDNAMDEVEIRGLDEDILFSVTIVNTEICISVCNKHDRIPYSDYCRFFSREYSSKGKEHGAGLPYIKKIVYKYGGHIEVGNVELSGDNYFSIQVYLKNEEHSQNI